MSQTKEEIEVELQEFKNENPDWKSVEWKSNTVTGFNNRLASFSATPQAAVLAPNASGLDLNTLIIEMLRENGKIVKRQAKIAKRQAKITEKVLLILEDLGDNDCYDRVSEASKPKELEKNDYTNAYGVPVPDLQCMVTGISLVLLTTAPSALPKNPVTLSHLLARCATAKEVVALGYGLDDIENIRNSILLCKNIERAFDRKMLSFVPVDKPFSVNNYKLHIWIDAVRTLPLFPGCPQTIGEFEGSTLNLMVGGMTHNPFKRAISFQAFRAFKKWNKAFDLKELPEDCNISLYEGTYAAMRANYALQLARDCAVDGDDDDSEDEENNEDDEFA